MFITTLSLCKFTLNINKLPIFLFDYKYLLSSHKRDMKNDCWFYWVTNVTLFWCDTHHWYVLLEMDFSVHLTSLHIITEILLKVALSTITLTHNLFNVVLNSETRSCLYTLGIPSRVLSSARQLAVMMSVVLCQLLIRNIWS